MDIGYLLTKTLEEGEHNEAMARPWGLVGKNILNCGGVGTAVNGQEYRLIVDEIFRNKEIKTKVLRTRVYHLEQIQGDPLEQAGRVASYSVSQAPVTIQIQVK